MRGTSESERPAGRRWRVIGAALIVLAMALALLTGCRADGDSWEQIQDSGVLRVGIDPTFPPFALAEGEQIQGLDADLSRALAGELGLEPQFTYFGYDGLYDALTTGQVDVLISALVIAPERTKEIAYTDAYFDAGQSLVVPKGASDVGDMDDLANRMLAVELGALGHVEALAHQRSLNGLRVQTYNSVAEALDAVVNGEADAALVDSVSGRLYLRDQPDANEQLVRLPNLVSSEPYAIAVRIEDQTLRKELNAALRRMNDSGDLEAIINDWLGP
jgi:polar amino acid transport system substrate-binding protein